MHIAHKWSKWFQEKDCRQTKECARCGIKRHGDSYHSFGLWSDSITVNVHVWDKEVPDHTDHYQERTCTRCGLKESRLFMSTGIAFNR